MSRRHGLAARLRLTDTAKNIDLTTEVTLLLQHTSALPGGTVGALVNTVAPPGKERTVTRRTFVVAQPEPLGIVIRSGAPQPKPARFWAYVWATDEDDALELHWHQRVPAEHAA